MEAVPWTAKGEGYGGLVDQGKSALATVRQFAFDPPDPATVAVAGS